MPSMTHLCKFYVSNDYIFIGDNPVNMMTHSRINCGAVQGKEER